MRKLHVCHSVIARAFGAAILIASPTGAQMTAPVVDVNGSHIVVNNPTPRSWRGTSVEINSYFSYTVTEPGVTRSLCINASAFVIKPSIRAGRDFDGVDIHFRPATMHVKTVILNGLTPVRVTTGMIQPLSPARAAQCFGTIAPEPR
jgi:hypothetical protein